MSKKSCPFSYSSYTKRIRLDFFDTQYVTKNHDATEPVYTDPWQNP